MEEVKRTTDQESSLPPEHLNHSLNIQRKKEASEDEENSSDDEQDPLLPPEFRDEPTTVTFRTNDMESHLIENPPTLEETEIIEPKGWGKYIGILCALLAALLNSFGSLSGKILTERNYHPLTIALWRYQALTTVIPFTIIYLRIVKKQNVFGGMRENTGMTIFLLVIRGTVGLCASGFFMYALKYLSVADVTVITFSTPIAVTLFARLSLGEPCGIVPIIIALFTFSGVVIVSRPPLITGETTFDIKNLIGIVFACGSMLAVAFLFVLIRYLRHLHVTVFMVSSGFVSTLECGLLCIVFGVLEAPHNLHDWFVAAGLAMTALLTQIFIVLSLKYEEAGPVALVRTSDVLFTFISQLVFLGVEPDMYSIIGAVIIVFGVFFTTFRKWLSIFPEEHPTRAKCWCILK